METGILKFGHIYSSATEAWYVVAVSPGSVLYAGLKRKFDERELRDIVAQGPVLLDQFNVLPDARQRRYHRCRRLYSERATTSGSFWR